MPFLPVMLAICDYCAEKARLVKGVLAGDKKDFQVPPVQSGRVRPGAGEVA